MSKEKWQKLPLCHKEAEKLDIILVCDGQHLLVKLVMKLV